MSNKVLVPVTQNDTRPEPAFLVIADGVYTPNQLMSSADLNDLLERIADDCNENAKVKVYQLVSESIVKDIQVPETNPNEYGDDDNWDEDYTDEDTNYNDEENNDEIQKTLDGVQSIIADELRKLADKLSK